LSEKENLDEEFSDILEDENLDEELSGMLGNDYFLPEASISGASDDTPFGFSGSLDSQKTVTGKQTSDSSVSKEDLVNLIKSREK